nr:protein FAR1-RELATED SEQUENCE 5-like [Ziziphus jujuba var. spinosa]
MNGIEEASMSGNKDGNMNDLELEANDHHIGVEEITLLSCSNSIDNVYIPQVSEDCKPKVGQEFGSIDEVHEFYNKYSKEAGFGVRTNSSKRYDKCKLKRYFWADSASRRAYGCYGDVIVFDTTYNTNQYGMIFAPLVGVNNHGQTILFACAFLSDERTESFIWLFELLKKTMPTNSPKMVITDQDPTLTKAMAHSLPNTFHRYCSWHILEKFSIQIDATTYKDFYKDFQNAYGNQNIQKSLKEAGMSSSQHAESSHAFFKKYVSKKNFLMDFILRFNRALAHQRHEELSADHVDVNEKPFLKLPLEMEK